MAREKFAAPDLRLFDCFAHVGYAYRPPIAPALTVEDLVAEMDRCGVDEALVHVASPDGASPLVANAELAAACKRHRRLHPVWSLLPPQTGEMPADKLFVKMRRNGVKMLRAYPDEHRYLLNSVTLGGTLEGMVAKRIPLFLSANWQRITDILKEFPGLIVIIANMGCWGCDRFFRPLWERFEHVYIETSTLELDGGIPELVAKYGANRILFGSGFHTRPMGGASLLLRNVDISRQDKELIAHGNLERLLEESHP
jgi:hypothetical protein